MENEFGTAILILPEFRGMPRRDGTIRPVKLRKRPVRYRVSVSGCHEALVTNGMRCAPRSQIPVNGKYRYVYRLLWEQERGPIPDGMIIMHVCDNSKCINLAHLRLGAVADNNKDRDAKGRRHGGPNAPGTYVGARRKK